MLAYSLSNHSLIFSTSVFTHFNLNNFFVQEFDTLVPKPALEISLDISVLFDEFISVQKNA